MNEKSPLKTDLETDLEVNIEKLDEQEQLINEKSNEKANEILNENKIGLFKKILKKHFSKEKFIKKDENTDFICNISEIDSKLNNQDELLDENQLNLNEIKKGVKFYLNSNSSSNLNLDSQVKNQDQKNNKLNNLNLVYQSNNETNPQSSNENNLQNDNPDNSSSIVKEHESANSNILNESDNFSVITLDISNSQENEMAINANKVKEIESKVDSSSSKSSSKVTSRSSSDTHSSTKKLSSKSNQIIKKDKTQSLKSTGPNKNPKIDTAQLLRRKSLTPSAKLIILCKKGDWLAVETFLKQIDKRTFDRTIVNEENNWTPLMYAARDNRVTVIEKLIQLGFNVNAKAIDNITALHVACMNAREDTIKLLLMKRVDTLVAGGPNKQLALHIISSKPTGAAVIPVQLILKNSPKECRLFKDVDNMIPLLYAVEVGNHGLAKELLNDLAKEQLEAKKESTGDASIHISAKRRDIEMIKLLVEKGCNVNLKNKDGLTSLHIAALNNDESLIRYLGGLENLNPDIQDKKHRTPLHIATEKGNTRVMDFLVDKCKVSLLHRTKAGSSIMHLVAKSCSKETVFQYMKKGVPLLMSDKNGTKLLHMAAMAGHVDIVRMTLQKGEKVDVATKDGYTALHLATENRQDQVIELLLGSGASINAKTAKNGETPLHLAAKTSNCLKCVAMLVSSGARINEIQNNKETSLHYAARCCYLDTFGRLIEEGARPDMLNNNGENVLHIGVRECHFPIVRKIINFVKNNQSDKSSNSEKESMVKTLINKQNKDKETCVHLASAILKEKAHYENEQEDIMQLLLEEGGDVTILNDKNETCIHTACKFGSVAQLQKIIGHLPENVAQIACNALGFNGWSPLFYACKNGHAEIIKILLNQNARVDIFDTSGTAGLHLASELGHIQVCEVLLENNAFVNVRNKQGMTPLHLAAENGFVELVDILIKKHEALIDAMTLTKQTPLHLAAKAGKIKVCKCLLNLNADVVAADNESQTALHLAARNNHSEVVRIFLEQRPELLSMPNKQGLNCALIAANQGCMDVLKELKNFNLEAVKFSVIKKIDATSLHLAAEKGYDKVVKFLLESGANPAKEDRAGMTALHLVAKFGHLKILNILKNYIDFKIYSRKTGLTALHVAAKNGQTDIVSEMLDLVPGSIRSERYALNPNADYGFTPLHLAAQFGHEGPVRLLMNSSGVKVDAASEINGIIPFHLAAQGGHQLVANLLISRSTDSLYLTDKFGRTCVHLAASKGRLDMINLLLGQGAKYDATDVKKWTPLHYASKQGYLDVVKLLIDAGANPLAETENGETAICFAVSSGHYDVLSYLLTKEHDSMQLMEDRNFLIDLMQCSKTNNNKPIEEFILKSKAPIEIAVKLAKCYDNLSLKEKQIGKDLERARDSCDQFAINLLSIVAIVSDAGKLLRAIDDKKTELLDILIELERKDVVSQHAVQSYLSDVWYGELKHFSARRWIFLMIGFVLCPLIWIAFSIPFKNEFSKVPIIKFMAYFTSHLYFIVLLTVTTIYPVVKIYEYTDCVPTWYEILLYIWLIGFFVSELISPGDKSGLGVIKNVIIYLGFCAIFVHLGAFILNNTYFKNDEDWNRLIKFDVFYLRNQILGLVLSLSFVELLNYLTFHPLFGPWGVIIIEILIDLIRFLVVLLIFLFGFTLHISSIYIAVYGPKKDIAIAYDFENVPQCFEMLFFALFGIVAHDYLPSKNYSPSFAKQLMKLVFGIYMTIVMIVLMNLLIAMMSNTYQRIEERSDIEWKYGRAKLIRNMTRMISTPPPINLFIGLEYQYYVKFIANFEKKKKIKQQFAKITLANLKLPPSAIFAGKKWLHKTAFKRAEVRSKLINSTKKKSTFKEFEAVRSISEVVDWNFIVEKYQESFANVDKKPEIVNKKRN